MKYTARVPHTAFLAFLIIVALPWYAYAETSPTTFDQFVDGAPGSEVRHEEDFPNDAYRAKRVNKNLWTFIDRRGY